MTGNRTILCMKWGTLYSADYVNVLFNACRQSLSGDFRFLCLTDDATGFLPEIEARAYSRNRLLSSDVEARRLAKAVGLLV